MARRIYGLTTADFAIAMTGRLVPGAVYQAWTSRTGGSRVTDLLTVDGAPTDVVTADASAMIGFQGPDEMVVPLWLDSGVGGRVGVRPLDITGGQGVPGPAGPSQPTGTGSPEGTRPGNRGDVWVQTDHPVANGGVLVWRKQTGAAGSTTGWKVVEGDTGFMVIASWDSTGTVTGAMPAGFVPRTGTSGLIQLRRVNSTVTLTFAALQLAATNPTLGVANRSGFRDAQGADKVLSIFDGSGWQTKICQLAAQGAWVIPGQSGHFTFRTEWTWSTPEPWPTSAPA